MKALTDLIERTLLLPARVLLTTMQARVTSLFRQGVLVCRPKSARRGHVKLKSNPSDSDGSEIQLDVVDVSPGSRPFFEGLAVLSVQCAERLRQAAPHACLFNMARSVPFGFTPSKRGREA